MGMEPRSNCWRLSWPKKTKRSDVHMLGCRKKEVRHAKRDGNARKKVLKSIVVRRASWFCRFDENMHGKRHFLKRLVLLIFFAKMNKGKHTAKTCLSKEKLNLY